MSLSGPGVALDAGVSVDTAGETGGGGAGFATGGLLVRAAGARGGAVPGSAGLAEEEIGGAGTCGARVDDGGAAGGTVTGGAVTAGGTLLTFGCGAAVCGGAGLGCGDGTLDRAAVPPGFTGVAADGDVKETLRGVTGVDGSGP
jgi:hypothetical protein